MPATAALTLSQDELAAWLRLALTPGVGNGAARRRRHKAAIECLTTQALFP